MSRVNSTLMRWSSYTAEPATHMAHVRFPKGLKTAYIATTKNIRGEGEGGWNDTRLREQFPCFLSRASTFRSIEKRCNPATSFLGLVECKIVLQNMSHVEDERHLSSGTMFHFVLRLKRQITSKLRQINIPATIHGEANSVFRNNAHLLE